MTFLYKTARIVNKIMLTECTLKVRYIRRRIKEDVRDKKSNYAR